MHLKSIFQEYLELKVYFGTKTKVFRLAQAGNLFLSILYFKNVEKTLLHVENVVLKPQIINSQQDLFWMGLGVEVKYYWRFFLFNVD